MSLFVAGLGRSSSKTRRATMPTGKMDISRLMVYVQQVEEDKLRHREEYKNKKAKSGIESGQQKGSMNRPFFQKQKGHAQLSASESPPRNRGEYNDQNSQNLRLDKHSPKVIWNKEVVGLLHMVGMVENHTV